MFKTLLPLFHHRAHHHHHLKPNSDDLQDFFGRALCGCSLALILYTYTPHRRDNGDYYEKDEVCLLVLIFHNHLFIVIVCVFSRKVRSAMHKQHTYIRGKNYIGGNGRRLSSITEKWEWRHWQQRAMIEGINREKCGKEDGEREKLLLSCLSSVLSYRIVFPFIRMMRKKKRTSKSQKYPIVNRDIMREVSSLLLLSGPRSAAASCSRVRNNEGDSLSLNYCVFARGEKLPVFFLHEQFAQRPNNRVSRMLLLQCWNYEIFLPRFLFHSLSSELESFHFLMKII